MSLKVLSQRSKQGLAISIHSSLHKHIIVDMGSETPSMKQCQHNFNLRMDLI